ncbi:hypothetical protein, partial [Frankia sp. Cj5]|uniref:hypothetical protein n=1 Tax=Frankia sp. Cj5 TaxID=2880978 RepID=UPI001EF42A44
GSGNRTVRLAASGRRLALSSVDAQHQGCTGSDDTSRVPQPRDAASPLAGRFHLEANDGTTQPRRYRCRR